MAKLLVNEEHKKLCEKHNVPYINEYSYGNYRRRAAEKGISVEEYISELGEIIKQEYLEIENNKNYVINTI